MAPVTTVSWSFFQSKNVNGNWFPFEPNGVVSLKEKETIWKRYKNWMEPLAWTEWPKNSCQTHEINIHVFFWSWYHFVAMYRMISSSLVKRWSWHVVLLELLSENFCSQNVVLLKLFTKNAGTMNRISWYWMNIIQNDTWSCLNCWRKMLHTKHGLAWTFHGKRRNNEQNILVLDECYPKRRCSPFGIYFTTEPVASLFLRKKNSKICSRLLYAAVHVSLRL